MNAEFNWWLLIVGLVVGAGLTWVVLLDARRREVDVDETERPREALWLAKMLDDEGRKVSPETVERLLTLHRAYLEAPPPDDPDASPNGSAIESASELAADDRIGFERGAADRGR